MVLADGKRAIPASGSSSVKNDWDSDGTRAVDRRKIRAGHAGRRRHVR